MRITNHKSMIQAKELRIGNYIQDYECEPYIFQVEELRKYVGYEIWAFYRKGSAKAKEVDPIPLTEEWLLKFGFRIEGDWTQIDFNPRMGIRFYGGNSAECDIIQDGKFIGFKNSHIQYVHQLQNLYFALTNTELIIK